MQPAMTPTYFGRVYRPALLSDLPLALGFVLLVCSAVLGAGLFSQEREADRLVRHTLMVENRLSQVQIEGLKAAVDVRTSVLIGRGGADVDIASIRRRYFANVAVLRALTADNPAQQARIARLEKISGYRFTALERAMSERRAGRIERAAELIVAPAMQAIIDRAKLEMDRIRQEELRLLNERTARAKKLEQLASWALGASSLLTLLLALIFIPERRSRIRSLWTTKQALESAVQAKRTFLANMSHEIRTPMNGMLGFTELVLAGKLSAEQRKRVELIDSSGRALMRLLNDILDFSKVEAGQMRIAREPFDLPHALGACMKLVSPAAARKGVELRSEIAPDIPRSVVGDGLRLRQVVLNLLGNAVKFTAEGLIVLRASLGRAGDEGRLILEVEDTGIGVEADRQEAIFAEFVQANSGIAPRFGGTGLGLSITAQLVRLMGGAITLESEAGRGSLFRISLPVEAAAEPEAVARPPSAGPEPRTRRGQRILLAEDHDLNQELFMAMLRQLGWRSDLAANGAEAIEMIAAAERAGDPYRAVLMDTQMPVLDGLEATRRIRASGIDGARLPVLAVTANAYESDVAACFAAGAQAHLAKPLKMGDLDRALRQWAGAGAARNARPTISASLRKRYQVRKSETLEALEQLIADPDHSRDAVQNVADLLHKLAGTAAMFGEADLGELARELELGIRGWTEAERGARLRAGVAQIRKAA